MFLKQLRINMLQDLTRKHFLFQNLIVTNIFVVFVCKLCNSCVLLNQIYKMSQ